MEYKHSFSQLDKCWLFKAQLLVFTTMLSLQSVSPLEILLQTIISQYFNMSYCLTIVAEAPVDCMFPVSFTYITVPNKNLTNAFLDVSERGCSDYIVRVNEPEMFMASFEEVNHLGNTRKSDRKIVLLPFGDDKFHGKKLLNILSLTITKFVSNLLIILPSVRTVSTLNMECNMYDLVTHKYVGSDDENSQPAYIDQWSSCTQKFRNYNNLFPHDMSNMYGKTLKVAAITYEPYTLLDIDKTIEPTGRDGTEVRLIDEFCRWINCTVEIIRNDDDYQWGEIYPNRTGVGLLGNLVADRADVAIGGLFYWYDEYFYLDFSSTTIRTAVTCVAPSPRIIANWDMPLMPFSINMWIAVFCTLIFAAICMTIVKRGSTGGVLLKTFGMLISQPQTDPGVDRTWRIRSVTAWLLISGLVIDNAYGGGLASVFTVPTYEPSIDTIQDLVDRGMEWGATDNAWVFYITSSTEPLIKQLVSLFRVKSEDELKELSFTRNMAYAFEKLSGGNFAIGDYITTDALNDLSTMTEDFYYGYGLIMLRKSSAYTDKLSKFIGRLQESGLLLAWENQVVLKHMNYEGQLKVRLSRLRKDVDTVEPLHFQQLVGIFYMYALGLLLSTVILILELLWYRQTKTI